MQQNMTRNSEAGFTLLELLLVVGVGALLLIGGIQTYRLVSESNKISDTMRLIMTVRNEAQNLSQGQGYTGVLEALQAAKVYKEGVTRNAFGGAFTPSVADGVFSIEIDGIPQNACKKMAMAIRDPGVKLGTGFPPATLTEAATNCQNEFGNTMKWTF